MPSLATLQSPGTWHLLTLSLVTGTTFFQRYSPSTTLSIDLEIFSFVGGVLQYKVPHFL